LPLRRWRKSACDRRTIDTSLEQSEELWAEE